MNQLRFKLALSMCKSSKLPILTRINILIKFCSKLCFISLWMIKSLNLIMGIFAIISVFTLFLVIGLSFLIWVLILLIVTTPISKWVIKSALFTVMLRLNFSRKYFKSLNFYSLLAAIILDFFLSIHNFCLSWICSFPLIFLTFIALLVVISWLLNCKRPKNHLLKILIL